ncbi:phosphoesterase [Glaciimonas sp. PCH181]|uniref:phosphoesterase n=1 Tax=Glaciimonas sp. PCH181 TaxID=2133943 RepID=UPI000D3853F1|nr:phosphoesterase [Glaciimonas sp. PCH181]PUA20706.1 phosphoesterase [Glaciimonas sp. PCH181]
MIIAKQKAFNLSLTMLAAAAVLAGCGGGGGSDGNIGTGAVQMSGVVTATAFKSGSKTDPTFAAGYYQGAMVCVDANNNGKCDPAEHPVLTDAKGNFTFNSASLQPLLVDTGTTAINTATGVKVSSRTVFRAPLAQVTEQGSAIVISPLSSEVARQIEANNSTYATEKQNLATRIGVPVTSILSDINSVTGAPQQAMISESNALANRFAFAITKLDRGDLFPDALAVPGGDPRLKGMTNVTAATATTTDTRTPITFLQSQQAAFNVEGIPRYDHIFIVMLENKASSSILNSAYAPKINAYLKAGNQLTSYYATGNPSEPNYTALGGADDFGITDDNQWNCAATGANAPQDLPLPDNTQPGLAKSPFVANPVAPTNCATGGASHNIVGRPNLFNALTSVGLTWRTYSESMNPGQDFRIDSVADAAVVAQDHVYAPGTLGGNAAAVGTTGLNLPLPAQLYRTKHHPGMAYQNVRSAPEFNYSNRTLGGGQWDANLKNSLDYTIPAGYDYDQLSTDLVSGNIGTLNFVVPDQCDDMHGITVKGTVGSNPALVTASDCSSVANNVAVATGGAIITRGDNYVDSVVKKIEGSPIWKNPQKRVAIVLMFDEGNATAGFNSCCGWNPANSTVANPLKQNPDGTWSVDSTVVSYTKGNRGHGESVFGILTNQTNAPTGISDSDAYSHFSFVRTLQDMFQLADPAVDGSYMNRSKYSENFVAANILNLPEYAGSADTHFDSVRPINHAFVAPATYTGKQSADVSVPAQVGPDATQANVWAIKK